MPKLGCTDVQTKYVCVGVLMLDAKCAAGGIHLAFEQVSL
jgi:hypothetical protein